MNRRRIPPQRCCADPVCGHTWRGWSQSCPECARRPRTGESLTAYRQRVLDPERNAS